MNEVPGTKAFAALDRPFADPGAIDAGAPGGARHDAILAKLPRFRAAAEAAGAATGVAAAVPAAPIAEAGLPGPPLPVAPLVAEPPRRVEQSRPADAAADSLLLLPRLPGAARPAGGGTARAFALVVIVPTLLVALYFYIFAANQYVAEFRFSVLQSSPVLPGQAPPTTSPTSGSSIVSGLSALVGGSSSISGASAQNFLVVDYLLSRDAIAKLQQSISLRALYDRPQADWWSRYASTRAADGFLPYWQSMVYANYDQVTGLARVEIRAFTPGDALLIASGLYKLSEALINDISNRPNVDAVAFADAEVKRARERLTRDQAVLRAFRDKEQVIDPTQSVVPTNTQQISAQQAAIIALKTQLGALLNQKFDKNAPTTRSLQAQIDAANSELKRTQQEVAKQRGAGGHVLTDVMSRYEKINLDIQYDQSMIIATQQALDQARANAAAQHLYLTPYVLPQLVTAAVYPRRLQNVLLAGLLFFAVWLAGVLVVRAIEDHAG